MGKEWLYYLGGGSRSSKRGKTSSEREIRDTGTSSTSATSAGCLNSLFQLFDFHHPFHFPNLHHQPSLQPPDSFLIPQEPITPPLKGVEAPRNSLEIEHTSFMEAVTLSSSLAMKRTGMQIKTSGQTRSSKTVHELSSSECSSSSPAGTKTPTLVARLMGLDLLPENSSPRPSSSSSSNHYSSLNHPSSSKSHVHSQQVQNRPKNNKKSVSSAEINDVMTGCRSLPETPRISSRNSDVDKRFSLQIIKENSNDNELAACQEFEFSKFLATKIAAEEENNMSPGHYAKQIVKQFKEGVSRRVGRDITNTIKNSTDEQRRDQHIVLLKSKKPSNMGDHHESGTPNSCSPRLRFLDTKNKPAVAKNNQICHSPKPSLSPLSPCTNNQSKCATVSSKPKTQDVPRKEEDQQQKQQKCRKIASEKYGPRLKKPPQTSDLIRNKQEESLVRPSSTYRAAQVSDKKCKKTPLSNHVPTLLSVKKEPSPPATRLLQKQDVQKKSVACDALPRLSRCLSQSYKLPKPITIRDDINSNGTTTTAERSTSTGEELTEYVSRILKCTGICEFTPLSFTDRYPHSHPLDPSIYHHLEISYPNQTIHGYHKKLIFELVNELLADIWKPRINLNPWICRVTTNEFWAATRILNGSQLIRTLCERIGSFPSTDCRVLEDIDALIDKDLDGKERSVAAVEEEGDEIVADIEGDLLERLVHETVAMVVLLRTA